MSDGKREMTLGEYLDVLPESHLARRQYRELKEKIEEVEGERDAILEVLNGSSAHEHLDKFREVDVRRYELFERWYGVCHELVVELGFGSRYDDAPGLFAQRVKKKIEELDDLKQRSNKCFSVKCNEENNSQEDIDQGRLNADVKMCPYLGWFNRHNNETGSGPVSPPGPLPESLDDSVVVVAGETFEEEKK